MVNEKSSNGLQQIDRLEVDVRTIPWSQRGSYISLSTLAGDRGLATPNIDVALVSQYKPYGGACFVLRPEITPLPAPSGFHTTPSPVDFHAVPEKLEWVHGAESVAQATFVDDRTLRLQGTVAMSFDTDMSVLRSYLYEPPRPSRGALDVVEWSSIGLMPLRFVAVRGMLSTIGATTYENGRITVRPDETGSWDLFVHERCPSKDDTDETTQEWAEARAKTSFAASTKRMKAEFEAYAKGMCQWTSQPNLVDLLGCYVMWTSTARAAGFMETEAVLMSKLWMNKVWSWDNCFNALALAAHPDLLQASIDNLMLPFTQQLSDGRIPDAMMYNEITWDFTKPPIYGWTLERLLRLRPDITDAQLSDIYTRVAKFTNMWLKHRRVEISRMPFYSHGNDSGWDNSTSFDEARVVVNADLASHLILQTDVLRRIASRLRLGVEVEKHWATVRDDLVEALIDELWDGEHFRVKNVQTGKTRASSSLLQYVPLTAARFLPKDIVEKMIRNLDKFLTPWGLATEPLDSPEYDSDGYWRGPIWAPSTILLESGIREAGHVEFADDIKQRFFKLCHRGGFGENYDAVTGEGHRDLSHTWSSSIYLVMRREAAESSEE